MTEEYVRPPKQEEYVPPVNTSFEEKEAYVAPPTQSYQEKTSEKAYSSSKGDNRLASNSNKTETNTTKIGYFHTPKMPLRFYMSSYLIFMLWGVFVTEYGIVEKAALVVYTVLSNYTYCWYADYKRATQSTFSWFFMPFQSARIAQSTSSYMNFQKGEMHRGIFGGYTFRSSADYGRHFVFFLLVFVITEFIKFWIVLVIAFITLFTHRSTIRKYLHFIEND